MYPVMTARLALRPVTMDDVGNVNAYRSLPEVALYLPHPPQDMAASHETVLKMAQQSVMDTPGQWLDFGIVLEETGAFVGEVLLKWDAVEPLCGEIGFAFDPSVQGQGIAFEACQAALKIAFENFGWHRVVGICDDRNDKSAALMKRLGMRQEAHTIEAIWSKGEWASDLQFAILDREWRAKA